MLAPYVRLKFYEALINEIFDIKPSKRVPKDRKPSRPKQIKTNLKRTDHQNKPQPAANKQNIYVKEDVELHPVESNRDQIVTTRIESTERKDTDDANLIKRISILDSTPPKYNFANIIQSYAFF